jgi:tetratricopeptide (TPR) repeat protein
LDKNSKVTEIDITDEYILAEPEETIVDIAVKLQKLKEETDHGAVLVTKEKDYVVGYVTFKEILDLVSSAADFENMTAEEIMSTDFEVVKEEDTIGDIIPMISEKYPNAVVVVSSDNKFAGYFSKNDYKEGLAVLGVYDKHHNPQTNDDWRTRGIALSSLGKRIEALKCFEKSVESSKDKEKGWTDLAKRLERLNKLKDSIACWDKVLKDNPNNDEALKEKGNLYSKAKVDNQALLSFKKAVQVNPDNAGAWMSLGVEQANIGEINDAMKSLDKAASIDEESPEIWFNKGMVFNKADLLDDALKCYNKAITLNDYYEEAWFNKGVTLSKLGMDKEALQCMMKILIINPANEDVRKTINGYKENGKLAF